jgi:hypothetical protein
LMAFFLSAPFFLSLSFFLRGRSEGDARHRKTQEQEMAGF